jgi:hypothetical protein
MKNVENEDKTVIFNLLQSVSANREISYSFKTFPNHIYLTISNIDSIEMSLLGQLYLASDRVKNIHVDVRAKSIIIQIKKLKATQKLIIKKRNRYNINRADRYAAMFVAESEQIRPEDERLITAIVTLFYKWTWNSAACDIAIEREGDTYHCTVANLIKLSYQQLKILESLGNWIDTIAFDFKNKAVLTFNVSRTETINNTTPQSKRIKYN